MRENKAASATGKRAEEEIGYLKRLRHRRINEKYRGIAVQASHPNRQSTGSAARF